MSSNDINHIIAKKIKLWRQARGLTKTQLEEKLGITYSQIMKYKNASNRISASRLYELAKILSVDVSDFFVDVSSDLHEESETEEREIIEKNQERITRISSTSHKILSKRRH